MLLEGEACVLLIETQVVLGARLALPGPGRGTEGGWAAGPGLPALRGPGGEGDAVRALGLGHRMGFSDPFLARALQAQGGKLIN